MEIITESEFQRRKLDLYQTGIKCEHCGERMFARKDFVVTIYPPRHTYKCEGCGCLQTM